MIGAIGVPQPDTSFSGPEIRMIFGGRELGGDREHLARLLRVPVERLIFPVQRHTDRVLWLDAPPARQEPADAVATDRKDIVLGIRTADCVPILLGDPRRGVVAAVHAGWRGTAARILEKTLDLMQSRAGTDPADVRMAIGPAIGVCCFEVGADVALALGIAAEGEKVMVDLSGVNEAQGRRSGILPGHIWRAGTCTRCRSGILHSYRREGGGAGRQVSLILQTGLGMGEDSFLLE